MSDAQAIWEAAQEVRIRYRDLFNESSRPEQAVYGEIYDSWTMFQNELEQRATIEKPDKSDCSRR